MAGTFDVLRIWERHGYFWVRVRLSALGQSTIIVVRFEELPSGAEAQVLGQAYVDAFEDSLFRSTNPLNKLRLRILEPLRDHTISVFIFLVTGILDTPSATLPQALNALVNEFPNSPFGNFQAFVQEVSDQFGGLTWDQFKQFVLNNATYFDPTYFEERVMALGQGVSRG